MKDQLFAVLENLIVKNILLNNSSEYEHFADYFGLCLDLPYDQKKNKIEWLRRRIAEGFSNVAKQKELFDLLKQTYMELALDDFHSYMIALEWNREAEEKFYQPRMRQLKPIVDALQMLADDELDELFLSQPPRTGKTTLVVFFITWIIGKNPELSNLYSSHSSGVTTSFYEGVMEIFGDPYTYLWHEIFPGKKIASQNAKEGTVNIDRRKRYASLTCRSIDGTLNGACDSRGYIIGDDLISGIEEALVPNRLQSKWKKVDNDFITRAKGSAKFLWIGTRWSMLDPAGVRYELVVNEEAYKGRRVLKINIPALDIDDKSNFDYDYGVGYDTVYYIQRRASFARLDDLPSWYAQYQGEPIERTGALFDPSKMRYFNGILPPEGLVRIFTGVDPAWGGGDFVSGPIAYEYEDGNIFIPDVMYNGGEKDETQPLLASKIIKHNVGSVEVEANRMTKSYAEGLSEELKARNYRCRVLTKPAPSKKAKHVRIWERASDIREFIFLEEGKRSKEYSDFMDNLFSFKMFGEQKNDDAPDSLAILANMAFGVMYGKATTGTRPF